MNMANLRPSIATPAWIRRFIGETFREEAALRILAVKPCSNDAIMLPMRKKLSTIGSSKGLILDKTLLGLLGIEGDDEVSLTVEGRRLIIEPVYNDPLEEIRARLPRDQDVAPIDRKVRAAARKARVGALRKARSKRAR
jgi:antitoxin component of MazEF toxin-antitoxin module